MKIIKFILFTLVTIVSLSIHAQTVDEVISKHIEAIGGKEKLKQIKSVYLETSMDAMGNTAPQKEYLLEGKGYKSEVDFSGTNIVQCWNDKNGWAINPLLGAAEAQLIPDAMYKSTKPQIYFGGALTDYSSKGYKAELIGKENGSFKIKVTADGNETYYFIDVTTYYLTKSIMKGEAMGQSAEITTVFSDHKKTDFGVVMAYTRNVDMGFFQYAQKIDKVVVNKEIDPKIFEMQK